VNAQRFHEITDRYSQLRLGIVGDFCLDRYFEIDPAKAETSIETGLPVHNVVGVRCQAGGAGTILNNLIALGIGSLKPVGFAGEDAEGRQLLDCLQRHQPPVGMGFFFRTAMRQTFCYTKPLVVTPGQAPVELNRLDFKNWTPTPATLQGWLVDSLQTLSRMSDALIVLDQVDLPETGVVTRRLLDALGEVAKNELGLLVIADSRRGLRGFPPVCFKMNRAELVALTGAPADASLAEIKHRVAALATNNGRMVFVTLAEDGIVGAAPGGLVEHVPALPVRGEIDIVGAGDAVTANLTAALAAGATLHETLELAMAAASIVVHQLGTTGTASIPQLREMLVG
jgi:rfaE bifunctional protein kinase chain/domain